MLLTGAGYSYLLLVSNYHFLLSAHPRSEQQDHGADYPRLAPVSITFILNNYCPHTCSQSDNHKHVKKVLTGTPLSLVLYWACLVLTAVLNIPCMSCPYSCSKYVLTSVQNIPHMSCPYSYSKYVLKSVLNIPCMSCPYTKLQLF